MTTDERFDEAITGWLERAAPARLPDRVLEGTFERTRVSRQQIGWRGLLGRMPMSRTVALLGGAAVVTVATAFALGSFSERSSVGGPSPSPAPSPFEGTWFSTSDADGGTQTMTVRVTLNGAVEIVVTDDIASVCGLTPSTMMGTGRLEGSTRMIIPEPVYTCDDGSEAVSLSGPPLADQLRNLTFAYDASTGSLADDFSGVWTRNFEPVPSAPPISEASWPQTSVEQVRQAQERADAGDPLYAWQVEPALVGGASPWSADVLDRFVREVQGWELYKVADGYASGDGGGLYDELVYLRCAPGQTNALYPDDPEGRGCAPTIDDLRYETAMLTLEQPARRDASGIWVVTDWKILQPDRPLTLYEHLFPDWTFRQLAQVVPPSDAEGTALVRSFLEARLAGEGAGQYLHDHVGEARLSTYQSVPMLLYATTGGAAYERYEIDGLQDPEWPSGWRDVRTRLFATDGTVVEQSFAIVRQEDGRLGLVYGFPGTDDDPTVQNGQSVPVPYSFLDGAVTFAAALPWAGAGSGLSSGDGPTFAAYRGNPGNAERFEIVADPRPVESACDAGPVLADAAALAERIRSDPDLQATEPVAVTVGGIDALRMDVVAAPGASDCDRGLGGPSVITDGGDEASSGWAPGWLGREGGRMRLYLLDLPAGSAQVLAIAIAAPESEFERVLEAAAPIVDSIEFQTP